MAEIPKRKGFEVIELETLTEDQVNSIQSLLNISTEYSNSIDFKKSDNPEQDKKWIKNKISNIEKELNVLKKARYAILVLEDNIIHTKNTLKNIQRKIS